MKLMTKDPIALVAAVVLPSPTIILCAHFWPLGPVSPSIPLSAYVVIVVFGWVLTMPFALGSLALWHVLRRLGLAQWWTAAPLGAAAGALGSVAAPNFGSWIAYVSIGAVTGLVVFLVSTGRGAPTGTLT